MSIRVYQIGARRHYAVPRALQAVDSLECLVTDACAELAPWRWLQHIPSRARPAALNRLLGRRSNIASSKLLGLFGWTARDLLPSDAGPSQTARWSKRNRSFCEAAVAKGFGSATAVYGFNGAALELFRAARAQGLRTALDQTAASWRSNSRMLEAEAERWPGWETLGGEIDQSGELTAREEAEWKLSDVIIAGSSFAARSVVEGGADSKRCRVVRYPRRSLPGVSTAIRRPIVHGPIKVLFVGTLTLRKGVQYLWQATQQLRASVEVRLVGPTSLSKLGIDALRQCMDVRGPRPREEIPMHLDWADVLVLPTLSEGSANVCHEALDRRLPVVTTENAGSDVVNGANGWIIPARSSQALVDILADRSAIQDMQRKMHRLSLTSHESEIEQYGHRLIDAMKLIASQNSDSASELSHSHGS